MKRSAASLAAPAMVALLLSASVFAAEDKRADRSGAEAGLVQIERAEVVQSTLGQIVLLRAQDKAIPIFVDPVVAQSIHGALTGEKFPRPLTHDLVRTMLGSFGGKVSRVVVMLKGSTYHADLTVVLQGTTKVFDSRSSDAIALAIHFKAPIFVSQELLEKAGKSLEPPVEPKPGGRRL